jgi:hypothetical protein
MPIVASKLAKLKVDKPLKPCPKEQPMANTAPTPMQDPPTKWRFKSAKFEKLSHLKVP